MSDAATVYIVSGGNYEDDYTESVWSTIEAAERHAEELRRSDDPHHKAYCWRVNEYEVQS